MESTVSGLSLVLVCDEWVTPHGRSADHVTPALVSPQALAAWCRKASPPAHWPRVFLWAQGRLHAPAEDPWVLPTPPASFRVCWAGPGQVPPDMCEHLALPFWTLNTVTSCPALASGLSPAGAEAVPPGSCHPQSKRAPGLRCKVNRGEDSSPAPEQAVAPRAPARRPQATPQTPGRGGVWQELGGRWPLGRKGRGREHQGRGGKVTGHLCTTREGLTDEGAWWGNHIGRE